MTPPYYEDEQVTLYHGDCLEMLPQLISQSFDCVITDPPYSDRTHTNARTPERNGVTAFAAISVQNCLTR